MAAMNGWWLEVMDIPAAFLKGLEFEELEKLGLKRQPVAFAPDGELWQLLGECSPDFLQTANGFLQFVQEKAGAHTTLSSGRTLPSGPQPAP